MITNYSLLKNIYSRRNTFLLRLISICNPIFFPPIITIYFPLMLQYCIITAAAKSQVSKVRTIAGNKRQKKAKRKVKKIFQKKKHDHVFQTFLPILPSKKIAYFFPPHIFLFLILNRNCKKNAAFTYSTLFGMNP